MLGVDDRCQSVLIAKDLVHGIIVANGVRRVCRESVVAGTTGNAFIELARKPLMGGLNDNQSPAIVGFTLASCATCFRGDSQSVTTDAGTRKDVAPNPQAATQAKTITAMFTAEGLTLSLTAICDRAERMNPFRAEIHAPRSLYDLIYQVKYIIAPDECLITND